MTENVRSPSSRLPLSRLFSLSTSSKARRERSLPPTPPSPPPLALRPNTLPFRGGVGDEAGWWWLLFTSPLSIPITLKLSINLTVKRFTRRGKRHRAPAISWSQMSRKRKGGKGRVVENSLRINRVLPLLVTIPHFSSHVSSSLFATRTIPL